jgi:hypothetical protein
MDGMRHLHATAIALALLSGCAQVQPGSGWLLMLPPLSADGYADRSAPLSSWQTFGSYVGQTDCNAAIARFQFGINSQVGSISHAGTPSQAGAVEMMSAECFAANDPRLAKQGISP